MEYFGFIIEHENEDYSKSIKDLINKGNSENQYRLTVIEYLKKGELCIPFMGCVEDANDPNFNADKYDDDDFIAYMAIYTDGIWYWPEYIITYLEKYPTIKIDENFVDYVLKNKDKQVTLSEKEISELEKKYLEKAGFKKEK